MLSRNIVNSRSGNYQSLLARHFPGRVRHLLLCALFTMVGTALSQATLETPAFGIELDATARITSIFEKPGKRPLPGKNPGRRFLWIHWKNKIHIPDTLRLENGLLTATFATANHAEMTIKVTTIGNALRLKIESVSGADIDRLRLAEVHLSAEALEAGWGVSVCALNEYTKGAQHPGMQKSGLCEAYRELGFEKGEAAVLIAKRDTMRDGLKRIVEEVPAIPKSTIGGPFALEAPNAYGSYFFAGHNVTEENVGEVIELADRLGLNQLNLHPVRYGDWKPSAKQYPEGRKSLKRVIDKIHAAGMLAGVHTYSEFISKSCPYVTPVPDRRLGVDKIFTLSADLDEKNGSVPIVEDTSNLSPITGFFVRNSATVRIDDELIVYKNAAGDAPFALLECQRGAHGTKIAPHAKGSKVHHLRECFGLFVPDGESTLFTELAHNLASLINECGFDMLYLDALDGSDAVAGRQWSWHYAAKFTLEVFHHLERPVLVEMSTFPHHLWYVRSRSGAWDHPTRSHKAFIDIHAAANRQLETIFLPSHLGWWAYKTWHNFHQEPTYSDDIEHLGARCLGYNSGVSIMGVNTQTLHTVPALARLAAISRQYEVLRRAGYFDDAIRTQLRDPKQEFALRQNQRGDWNLRPSTYIRHKVTAADNGSQQWSFTNPHAEQTPFLRIQTLHSVGSATNGPLLAKFAHPEEFGNHKAIKTVKASLKPSEQKTPAGERGALLTATNAASQTKPSWASWQKIFDPPLNLTQTPAMGVWIHGDGKGEILNLQLRSPTHLTYAYGEHYINVDFSGWKYFELVEPDGEKYRDAQWPYRSWYAVYRSSTRYNAIRELNIFVNNVPAGETVNCIIGPIHALPLRAEPLENPTISVADRELRFPTTIATGNYLEYDGTVGRLFNHTGTLLDVITPAGRPPRLKNGENSVEFSCGKKDGTSRPRAMLTLGTYGLPLKNSRGKGKVKWEEMNRENDLPHQITALDGKQNQWRTIARSQTGTLDFELTLHALKTPEQPYESATALMIDSFDDPATFANTPENNYLQYVRAGSRSGFPTSVGTTHALTLEKQNKKFGKACLRYTAKASSNGGWSARGVHFGKPLDLAGKTHIGFWLHGDALGETLYFQFWDKKGEHFDMKTKIDFSGWRFVDFPLARPNFDQTDIEYLILYYNGLPAKQQVTCLVDAMQAYEFSATLRNPKLTVGTHTLEFPVALHPGDILSYNGTAGTGQIQRGEKCISVAPSGRKPKLRKGENQLCLTAEVAPGTQLSLSVQTMKRYR